MSAVSGADWLQRHEGRAGCGRRRGQLRGRRPERPGETAADVQDAHNGDDHHPAGLIRLAAVAAALVAATGGARSRAAIRRVAVAAHAADGVASDRRRRVGGRRGPPAPVLATLRVGVSIDTTGSAVRGRVRPSGSTCADRRLLLHDRRAGHHARDRGGIDAPPPACGRGAYLWQGFNPGRRILAATVELGREARRWHCRCASRSTAGAFGSTNATPSTVAAYAADGNPAQLRAYLAALRAAAARGEPATGGGTTSPPRSQRGATADLGAARDRRDDRREARTADARRQRTTPRARRFPRARSTSPCGRCRRSSSSPRRPRVGRALFARATRASLEMARSRQYDTFLGNPDPAGPSQRDVRLPDRARPPPVAAPPAPSPAHGRDWTRLLLIVAGSARRRRRCRGRLG